MNKGRLKQLEESFQYKGVKYRRNYMDALQLLYMDAENANNAIGNDDVKRMRFNPRAGSGSKKIA